jgi:peptide/nickel transport system ATP-binding protein
MSDLPQVEMQAVTPVLEAVHLRKYFPGRGASFFNAPKSVQAVDDFSLALYPGRATALVGESGSGKTTVARLFSGTHTPTRGVIRFEGETGLYHVVITATCS